MNHLRTMIAKGWKIVHEKGTAYVGLNHPGGGKISLVEVKAGGGSGSPLTVQEADEIAASIAVFLNKQFDPPETEWIVTKMFDNYLVHVKEATFLWKYITADEDEANRLCRELNER